MLITHRSIENMAWAQSVYDVHVTYNLQHLYYCASVPYGDWDIRKNGSLQNVNDVLAIKNDDQKVN
jgi:hypothetical protein